MLESARKPRVEGSVAASTRPSVEEALLLVVVVAILCPWTPVWKVDDTAATSTQLRSMRQA